MAGATPIAAGDAPTAIFGQRVAADSVALLRGGALYGATSGGGAVKVTVKCDGTIAAIKIDPQALNPSDAQLLEDMILTATNQALNQAKEIANAEMSKVTAGLNLPGFG